MTNKLDTNTSLHWHGLLVSYRQDGVFGVLVIEPKGREPFKFDRD